jgi:hypothetical protein
MHTHMRARELDKTKGTRVAVGREVNRNRAAAVCDLLPRTRSSQLDPGTRVQPAQMHGLCSVGCELPEILLKLAAACFKGP